MVGGGCRSGILHSQFVDADMTGIQQSGFAAAYPYETPLSWP